ncbi:MAG: hypothetical protein ACJ8F1_00450 [Polyangia bacterium]|jgi:hypothetical protein
MDTRVDSKSRVMQVVWAVMVFGAIFSIGVASRADSTSEVQTKNGAARVVRKTAKVTAIDTNDRLLSLQSSDGQTNSVKVPADIKGFDQVKVGDNVDIEYYEGIAVSLLPPGSKPSMSQHQTRSVSAGTGANVADETTVSAEILAVDLGQNIVSFKSPNGTRTVQVRDPRLQHLLLSLKPGQVVQVTYRQATAASLRPAH